MNNKYETKQKVAQYLMKRGKSNDYICGAMCYINGFTKGQMQEYAIRMNLKWNELINGYEWALVRSGEENVFICHSC